MGEVYRARDQNLDRDVAVKVLPAGHLGNDAARRRFRREALSLSNLNHPNIVTIHDFDSDQGVDFLIMELVAGQTLESRLAHGALSQEEALHLGAQIAAGLDAAHRAGIVHRDLKPANIIVTGDGRAKILDFGLARTTVTNLSSVTTATDVDAGKLVGTLPYMAPEQLRNETPDGRTDIWALGAVLYEMLTGHRPFTALSPPLLCEAILHQTPPPVGSRTEVADDLARVVERCLRKSPAARFQAAGEVRALLESVDLAAGTGSPGDALTGAEAGRPASRGPVDRPSRRSGLLLGAVSVALLGGGLAITWLLTGDGAPDEPALDQATPPAAKVTGSGRPAIAVLPFRNLTADVDNDYFSLGVTEEILDKLTHLSALDVVPRESRPGGPASSRDPLHLGRQLDVTHVLDGSVRRSEDRVRIAAQLIDAGSGIQVWSQVFESELENIFAVQEETALAIAEALGLHLSEDERQVVRRRYTESIAAYDLYLRGQAFSVHWSSPDLMARAEKAFEEALRIDPEYAPAMAGLANVLGNRYRVNEPNAALLARADRLARSAVHLAPELSETHWALGNILGYGWDYAGAAREFRRAVQLGPDNARAWTDLAWALTYVWPPRPEEAEAAAREALRLEPGLFIAHYQLGRALLLQNHHDEAEEAFVTALRMAPDLMAPHMGLALLEIHRGDLDAAWSHLEHVDPSPPLNRVIFVRYCIARGDLDGAFAHLEQALADGYGDFEYLTRAPELQPLRDDPRFGDLIPGRRPGE